jgi:hypothetical protein
MKKVIYKYSIGQKVYYKNLKRTMTVVALTAPKETKYNPASPHYYLRDSAEFNEYGALVKSVGGIAETAEENLCNLDEAQDVILAEYYDRLKKLSSDVNETLLKLHS